MIAKSTLLKSVGAVVVVGAGLGLLAVNLPQDSTKIDRPDTSVTPSAEATPSATPKPSPPPAPPAPEPEPQPESTEQTPFSRDVQEDPPTKEPITLYPTTGILSQAAIDTGGLITWYTDPMILAGHDYSGWAYLADLDIGTIVVVAQGPASGTYQVTGSYDLVGTDHYVSELPYADLVLQSCTSAGLGFSLATRVN